MTRKPWTTDELSRLRVLYPTKPTRKVAELLKRSVFSINGAASTVGLRKTEEYLQSPEACRLRRGQPRPGVATQFRKGRGSGPAQLNVEQIPARVGGGCPVERRTQEEAEEATAMKNRLSDLRNHLFETLEQLKDEEKPMDLQRAKAISEVAQTIINSAKVEVEFAKAIGADTSGEFFGAAGTDDDNRRRLAKKPLPRIMSR